MSASWYLPSGPGPVWKVWTSACPHPCDGRQHCKRAARRCPRDCGGCQGKVGRGACRQGAGRCNAGQAGPPRTFYISASFPPPSAAVMHGPMQVLVQRHGDVDEDSVAMQAIGVECRALSPARAHKLPSLTMCPCTLPQSHKTYQFNAPLHFSHLIRVHLLDFSLGAGLLTLAASCTSTCTSASTGSCCWCRCWS